MALIYLKSHWDSFKKLLNMFLFLVCAMCHGNDFSGFTIYMLCSQTLKLKRLMYPLRGIQFSSSILAFASLGTKLFLVHRAWYPTMNDMTLIRLSFNCWLVSLGPYALALPWDKLPGPRMLTDKRTGTHWNRSSTEMEIGETPTCFWSCQIPFLGSVNL